MSVCKASILFFTDYEFAPSSVLEIRAMGRQM